MRIALVTEGTYPYAHGGVSTWCDQLVRGLSEHTFEITAITATGTEPLVWELPANVDRVVTLPLWAGTSTAPKRVRSRAANQHRAASRHRAANQRRANEHAMTGAVLTLVASLVEPEPQTARSGFDRALRELAVLAPHHDLVAELTSPLSVALLMNRWSSDGERPTVGDAVTAIRLVAHALRPLAEPAPRADVVHLVANGLAGLPGLTALWRHGTPYVLSEHGVYLRERYLAFGDSLYSWPVKWLMMRFYRLLTHTVYRHAALVAPGNLYNQRWERWEGVAPDAIRTVYNGVDPDEFAVRDDEPTVPTIAWVGRIDPIKDVETLVRAFAIVHERLPQARLRLFGGTPRGNEAYLAGLQALVAHLGLAGAATFEGRVDLVQDGYAAGNLVALTSISEGFPYTVIEAMSCGRATVSTDVGGVAEAVGDAGLVVPPRDPQAFAAACLRLLEDDAERTRLAARARRRVVELFTLERSLQSFREIYRDVHARAGAEEVAA